MQNTFTIEIPKGSRVNWASLSGQLGLTSEPVKSQYESARLISTNIVVVAYLSGKIVVQGKGATEEFKEKLTNALLGDEAGSTGKSAETVKQSFEPHIGVDEVGKGDYYGPMIACAVFLDAETAKLARKAGVGDSKKIMDSKILEIYESLKGRAQFEVSVLTPELYNAAQAKYKNVAIVLAHEHSRVIEALATKLAKGKVECKRVVIDQFSSNSTRVSSLLGPLGKKMKFVQFHKGESDLAVAAASVFARATFLLEWQKMEAKYGVRIPKGATTVIGFGRDFVRNYGADRLKEIAKISFKTTKDVLAG